MVAPEYKQEQEPRPQHCLLDACRSIARGRPPAELNAEDATGRSREKAVGEWKQS